MTVVAFVCTLTVHAIAADKEIAPATTAPVVCLNAPSAKADDLSRWGMKQYQSGRYGEARDCWRLARKLHQGAAAIDDQINQAQAEQALGLYPLACKTLLPIYSPDIPDCKALPRDDIDQDEKRQQEFLIQAQKRADTSEKIAGLRSLGNVLRGVGELELSEQLLSLEMLTRQPNKGSLLLDLGNTQRALSERAWDLFLRSSEPPDLQEAVDYARKAIQQYEVANSVAASAPTTSAITQQQAQLNQFSFLLEQQRELSCLLNQWGGANCQNQLRQLNKAQDKLQIQPLLKEVQDKLTPFLADSNSSTSLSALLSQMEQLPTNHTALHLRLNLTQSLLSLSNSNLPEAMTSQWQSKLEPWMKKNVELTQNDSREHTYALGYLGKWYQNADQWQSAKTLTQQALLTAQSIPAQEIAYQWQWQLGQIYKAQSKTQTKSKAQPESQEVNYLPEARKFYQGAFETLQSLRRELAASNPDTQLSFQKNIETIYREYTGLLLTEEVPNPSDLVEARQVIAALQAVELENFLRQGCPENNLTQIDRIIDTEVDQSTASFYPIVLDSEDGQTVRLEVILKLPNRANAAESQPLNKPKQSQDKTEKIKANNTTSNQAESLRHYRKTIDREKFTHTVKELQRELEEEYTFYSLKKNAHQVYQWLLEEAEQSGYLKGIHTLVFALDTRLRNIPLAALVYDPDLDSDDRQGYLIEKYAVAIAPRLGLQAAERFPAKKLNVLAVGLSEKPTVKFRGRLEKRFFPGLPYVKKELQSIELSDPGRLTVLPLLNKQFTQNEFQQAINTNPVQILHLATHGEFSSRPEGTFILSADDHVINVTELERIFRERNQNQANTIDLLILSACETAMSDQRATLGISGVAVRAGARGAIASLWTLDDEVSVEFTERLYKKLTDPKLTKVQALREAQLELARVDGYQHPRYWAPYIFVGNWL